MLEVAGKPLILHTLQRAQAARTVWRVIVATDDQRISRAVTDAGGEAVLTSAGHISGSDRLAEVAESLPEGMIVVNVQGDEPMISPHTIDAAVRAMTAGDADIVTTCEPISAAEDLLNSNVVKVVTNDEGFAVYFSRSPIPFPREASLSWNGDRWASMDKEPGLFSLYRKHTGLYVYRREYLLEFTRLPPSKLERIEMLEQLRALENGARIKVIETSERSIGVDTQEDLDRVRAILEAA